MIKVNILALLLITTSSGKAQNIFSALHMTENMDYKTARPKMIIEANIFYGRSGETQQRHIKSFDDASMLVSFQNFDKDNNLTGKTTYINDTVHRVVLSSINDRYDEAGQPYGKETAAYMYDRNMAITAVYANDGRKLSTDSMKISFVNAHQFPDGETKFNEKGDIVETDDSEYEYKYDQFGNCLEQKIYKVTTRPNGKKKKVVDSIFKKEYVY